MKDGLPQKSSLLSDLCLHEDPRQFNADPLLSCDSIQCLSTFEFLVRKTYKDRLMMDSGVF